MEKIIQMFQTTNQNKKRVSLGYIENNALAVAELSHDLRPFAQRWPNHELRDLGSVIQSPMRDPRDWFSHDT